MPCIMPKGHVMAQRLQSRDATDKGCTQKCGDTQHLDEAAPHSMHPCYPEYAYRTRWRWGCRKITIRGSGAAAKTIVHSSQPCPVVIAAESAVFENLTFTHTGGLSIASCMHVRTHTRERPCARTRTRVRARVCECV